MKQACLKRVLCYACCLSLVLGVFAYRPTRAEAVFVSPLAALGASLIASVVVGTTATFFVESGAADDIGEAIDFLLEEYISVMDELTTYTPQDICEIVGNGASMLENGVIQLSSHAGNLTAGFINWLRAQEGLEPDGASVVVYEESGLLLANGDLLPYVHFVTDGSLMSTDSSYVLADFADSKREIELSTGYRIIYTSNGSNSVRVQVYDPSGSSIKDYASGWPQALGVYQGYLILSAFTGDKYFYNTYDNKIGGGAYISAVNSFALQPNPEFQEIPGEILEGQLLSIDTGLTVLPQDDPQAIADAIMGAINAGTLSPSVSIEGQSTDIPGTDTDDDTAIAVPGADADLLDWTKYIGQKVASIPKAIGQSVAEAVAAAFSPDPKLVNEITGAFSAKFGFVETLKHVGDDMFGMTAASVPPVVWIHLEDAEGRYDYGGTVKALDMAWYQRYKADVDRILGGFLWLAYLWLLFKRLPDILSGAGMTAAESQYIDDHQLVSGQWIKVRRSKRL